MAKLFKLENPIADITLIGIVSSENDYKISWSLNEALHISLKRNENIKIPNTKTGQISEFPFYSFEEEETALKYLLIQNRNNSFFYIPELKKFDFLFILQNIEKGFDVSGIIQNIKISSFLSSAFQINPEIIKNKSLLRLL